MCSIKSVGPQQKKFTYRWYPSQSSGQIGEESVMNLAFTLSVNE